VTFSGLDRDDLVAGLREVIERAGKAGLRGARIQIIGGAALKLAYFERAITVDVDAQITPAAPLMAIAESIAIQRGWPANWLNDEAKRAGFLPSLGRTVEWTTIYSDETITVEVASAEALLAMKLRAFERRGRRDVGDVLGLLALLRPETVDDVEEAFEEFFPGDALKQSTADFVARAISEGLPVSKDSPGSLLGELG
jgi:Nucleotidyl transferase AbiEii toxin, Type IV TA system